MPGRERLSYFVSGGSSSWGLEVVSNPDRTSSLAADGEATMLRPRGGLKAEEVKTQSWS